MYCVTRWKVAGSRPDEVNYFFFSVYLPFWPHKALGFTQPLTEMSTKSTNIMFLDSRAQLVLGADSLTAICEPIV
jgi:hypothetical protein